VNYGLVAFFFWDELKSSTSLRLREAAASRGAGGGGAAEGQGRRRRGNWGRKPKAAVEQLRSLERETEKVGTGKLKLKLGFLDNINIYVLYFFKYLNRVPGPVMDLNFQDPALEPVATGS